jgi:hypothetical protein
MTPRLSGILTRFDLPAAELCAMRLDGEVYQVDDSVAALDELNNPALRARILAAQVPSRLIAEQRSAAWVWGARHEPPAQHQLCANTDARVRPPHARRLSVREVVISPDEISVIGTLELTSPLRTAIDLARFADDWDDRDSFAVTELMRIGRFDINDCVATMNVRKNLPNKRQAISRLEGALVWQSSGLSGADAINVVDRVDTADRVQNPVEMGRVTHLEHKPAERKAIA